MAVAWSVVLIWILASEVLAQPRGLADDASVTVRVSTSGTDRATQAMREVADRIDAAGVQLSLLSGGGGPAAARDLLFRPGVEFAVLRSDLLPYLAQKGELPEAAERLRYVTHLYTDKVYVWVREGLDGLSDFEGKRIAVIAGDNDARVTAQALVGLAGIQAEVVDFVGALGAGAGRVEDRRSMPDAVVLVGAQMVQPLANWVRTNGYRLLALSLTPELARGFVAAEIPAEAAGTGEGLPTLGTAVFIATFDWNLQGERFPKVNRFITSFYRSLTDLRAVHPASVWRETDIALQPGAWQRFAPAAPERIIKSADMRALGSVEPPLAYLARPAPATSVAAQPAPQQAVAAPAVAPARLSRAAGASATGSGTGAAPPQSGLSVAVVRRPPFTDDKSANGNVALEVLRESLKPGEGEDAPAPDLQLMWTDRQALLDPRGSPIGAAQVSFPWQRPDCDDPGALTQAAAFLCDQAIFSKPIMRVVAGVYVDAARRAKFMAAQEAAAAQPLRMTVCAPADAETANVPASRRSAPDGPPLELTVIKRPTLVHCIAAAQTEAADGFLAADLEARQATARLGLSGAFEIFEPTLFTDSLHVAAPRDNPESAAVIARIDAGLARLKSNGAYAQLMEKYVVAAWKANR